LAVETKPRQPLGFFHFRRRCAHAATGPFLRLCWG
jgi:hypothetical protein